MKTTLGGDRLGAGNKQEISMKNYGRSSHDLGYVWRSTMASGTLVPFMSEIGLPGDSFDIDLNVDVKTLPTTGPLFGSYKVQMDIFQCPVRLYQGKLHMNMLNIGMDMSEVKLPQMEMEADYSLDSELGDNQQINSSSIFSYLNIRGLGRPTDAEQETVTRKFNALSYLSYWDIYKQYYSNKQEERGFVIHADGAKNSFAVSSAVVNVVSTGVATQYNVLGSAQNISIRAGDIVELMVGCEWLWPRTVYGEPTIDGVDMDWSGTTPVQGAFATTYINQSTTDPNKFNVQCVGFQLPDGAYSVEWLVNTLANRLPVGLNEPLLTEFPLENIDDMRMQILEAVRDPNAFEVNKASIAPYGLPFGRSGLTEEGPYFKTTSQEGLGIKTYQSDLFNNWISTEWIDGANGINEITSVDTTTGAFTIDSLNLAYKVYQMLNRIALSGGTYDDWLDATYTHERAKGHENPVYMGSLIRELAFEEVVSNSDTLVNGQQQPLGTLAGRGRLTQKNKGGKIKVKCDEMSYIIGIASITPKIDYSQGNKFDVNLETMNDFHKPQMDEIGFQSLLTDQMAWFDSGINSAGKITYKSAGKQPAWINYMTNVNQTRGHFAEEDNSMFMTLNRRYEKDITGIRDLTTYIDPSKYNNIFADGSLDSQNFWVQIGVKNRARRKMSAKVIPNL